jgi:phage-related protein
MCVLIPHLEACEDTAKKGTKVRSIRALDDFFASFLAAIDPGILQAIGLGVKQVLPLNLQRPRRTDTEIDVKGLYFVHLTSSYIILHHLES